MLLPYAEPLKDYAEHLIDSACVSPPHDLCHAARRPPQRFGLKYHVHILNIFICTSIPPIQSHQKLVDVTSAFFNQNSLSGTRTDSLRPRARRLRFRHLAKYPCERMQ